MNSSGLVVGLELAQRLHRRDLVGVDVVLDERDGDAGVRLNGCITRLPSSCARRRCGRRWRWRPQWRGSRDACASSGPGRFSKLRLVVETMRSPGSPRSPLPPAHIEQPDSPQAKPASRNTLSRPLASASRFTGRRARHHHGDHAFGNTPPAHHVGGGLEVGQPRIGAGADEHAVDRQARERRAGREAHVGERAFHDRAPVRIGRRIGHAAGDADHLARVGAPGDLRLERRCSRACAPVSKRGVVVAPERAPMRERCIPLRALRRQRPARDPVRRSRRRARQSPSARPSRC